MEDIYLQDLLQIEEADPEQDDAAPEQEAETLENIIEEENIETTIKLDYKLKTCEERAALVDSIVARTPQAQLTNRYLEILGDYIMGGISKEEKKEKLYLTDNRLITINKRETSYESLAEKFENGEDGIYNLIRNDKNAILTPKVTITEEDIATIPGLKQLREEIDKIEVAAKAATGRNKYLLKKQLIEMRKDQYILKNARSTISIASSPKGINKIDLTSHYWLDENKQPCSDGLISFFDYKHISAILCNYNALKIETNAKYFSDFYYLMEDFDGLLKRALENEIVLRDIVEQKTANKTNLEIQEFLLQKHNKTYTIEYLSSLWRNKIPKLIAERAKEEYLYQYYHEHPSLAWKTCSRCGARKPAHSFFFSKNNTAKDGWYCQCKACRNSKNKDKSK